ncbi:MAG: M24 family metallopeptidase [Actinomycetota bacterium]
MDFPKIPQEEFKQRMANFKKKIAENGLDLVAIYSNLLDPSAVRYFSDVSPINESAAMVIPLEGEPILCSGQACHEWSGHKSMVEEIRVMPEVGEVSGVEYNLEGQMDFEDLFREMEDKYGVKKIGIVGELIFPYEIYKKIEKVFPEAEKINAEGILYELRMQKSENEIACIKKAGEIITNTFSYAASRVKSGVSELDIQADIEAQMLRLGAEAYCNSFAPMIPSGRFNSNLCMNRNTLRKVKEGEIIDLQAGTLYEGYNAVICTPLVIGDIPEDIKEAVKAAHEAENVVAGTLRPGTDSRELYKIYNNYLKEKGYEKYSPYGSVHSIGMLECETPFFSAERKVPLLENMAIAIDVYFKGLPWGSFRIEDTYIIRENGAELVTTFNKNFIPEKFM